MITDLRPLHGGHPGRPRGAQGHRGGGLGMMIGTIGEGDSAGELRMATYDMPYLVDGLKLVIVGLGIFAIPEIVALLRQDRASPTARRWAAAGPKGVSDWFRQHLAVGPLFDHRRRRGRDPGPRRLGRRLDRLWPFGADHQGQVQVRLGRDPGRDRAGKLEQRQGRRRARPHASLRHPRVGLHGDLHRRHRASWAAAISRSAPRC